MASGRLDATTRGGSAIATEKDGLLSPARPSKYFTRGPRFPIRVETKMVPGTPVSSSGRFVISTKSSSVSSSAMGTSVGTAVVAMIGMAVNDSVVSSQYKGSPLVLSNGRLTAGRVRGWQRYCCFSACRRRRETPAPPRRLRPQLTKEGSLPVLLPDWGGPGVQIAVSLAVALKAPRRRQSRSPGLGSTIPRRAPSPHIRASADRPAA